jgi:hypothetical protein
MKLGAPFGNKNALGNNGGRPPLYDDAEKLASDCDDYLQYIAGEWDEQKKQWIREPERPTITGLCIWLGFRCKNTLYNYIKIEGEIGYVMDRARLFVEYGYEKQLHGDRPTGAIFALKNMGWKDTVETNNTTNMNLTMTKEEELKIAKDLEDSV